MQRPKDLSREQLEAIADELQQRLYLSYNPESDSFYWDPEKEWSGFDVCEGLAGVLSQLGMIPEQRSPFT
jgi:hypothetical protein